MSDFMLMAPANQTFGELFSNGVKYEVPKFQRDYAWSLEEWEDLWLNIEAIDDEKVHYMGYMVLQQKSQHEFIVIDGQQRLITLSVIVLAVMKKLQNLVDKRVDQEANKQRLTVFTDRFIGVTNAVILTVENKLSLNRNNRRNFRNISSNLKPLREIGMSRTNLLLNEAFDFFVQKITIRDASELARFVEKLADKLFFTKIVTQDSINAYKMFETLNARGVQLSTPDLLKNHIFSTLTRNDNVTDTQLDDLDEEWAFIIAQLGAANFTDFICHHHNMQMGIVSRRGLFKSVKQMVETSVAASNYLRSLVVSAPIYSALLRSGDEWWRTYSNYLHRITHYLTALRLFEITQPFSILMAVILKNFTNEEFCNALKYLYILSVRYNIICHFSPNEQEKAYNKIAMKVFNGEFK